MRWFCYIQKTVIFIFSFCIGFVTQLNDSAVGVLKYHYITKRIPELLLVNWRFVIHILLNQLLFYTDIKESSLSVDKIVKSLDLNNFGWPDGLTTVFSRVDRF